MIYTSYFAKYKGNDGVSITHKKPLWFNGESYDALGPTAELLNWWKSLTEDEKNI